MTKYNGTYYLQYAAPGTAEKSYANGCYISESPTGPFTFCEHSPISFKATGFLPGMGHGSLIQDKYGGWWKFDTAALAVHHYFERRLVMFPADFNDKDELITNAVFSDYPLYRPSQSRSFSSPAPCWMLLSCAQAAASSSLPEHLPDQAFNEDIRSRWSAETDNAGEWLTADLGALKTLHALQINFADQDVPEDIHGRDNTYCYTYLVELSQDGQEWYLLIDKSEAFAEPNKAQDSSHDYFELEEAVRVRYIRITNKGTVPGTGKFSISGLRLFGHGQGKKPPAVSVLTADRQNSDRRSATISWNSVSGAEGYIVRYGIRPDMLNIHYQVTGKNSVTLRNLNVNPDYHFRVDAYNENGVTQGITIINTGSDES